MSEAKTNWQNALPTETRFWDKVASGELPEYQQSLMNRAAGRLKFPPHLAKYLKTGRTTRILDVGSGPHTVIGKVDVPSPIEVVAIDPLADDYNATLKRNGITPSVPTIFGEAERLPDYALGKFDLVYSRNALDHSYDPVTAIKNMLQSAEFDGAVYFEGSINEAEKQRYVGLHQWNFDISGSDLIIWNKEARHSLTEVFGDKAIVMVNESTTTWYKVEIRHSASRTL